MSHWHRAAGQYTDSAEHAQYGSVKARWRLRGRENESTARFKQAGGDAPGKIMENAANIRNKELKLQKLVYEGPSVPLTFSDVEDKVKF